MTEWSDYILEKNMLEYQAEWKQCTCLWRNGNEEATFYTQVIQYTIEKKQNLVIVVQLVSWFIV